MHRHELTDSQWAQLQPLLRKSTGPRAKLGDRNFINAVVWRVKTGVPWRDLPERFGPWKTVYNRFTRWAGLGRWEEIFKRLQLEPDDLGSLVDGSIVRAHQDSAGGKGGSNAMLWAVLQEVFPPEFTRSRRLRANRST